VVIVEKVTNIYQNSRSQTAVESGQFPDCRPNPSAVVVSQLTKQFRRVGIGAIGGVYWA